MASFRISYQQQIQQGEQNKPFVLATPTKTDTHGSQLYVSQEDSLEIINAIPFINLQKDISTTLQNGTSVPPSTSPTIESNVPSKTDHHRPMRIIYGVILVVLAVLVAGWGIWMFRREIRRCCSTSWTAFRQHGCKGCIKSIFRRNNQQQSTSNAALNDIIFDPDEEQSASVSRSLLL